MSKVDKMWILGMGYLSYSGRPQTVPFLCYSLQLLHTVRLFQEMAQKWAKVTPFYDIVNLVLYSNFDIYMFYLLIYF